MACHMPISLDAGSSLPRNIHARYMRCQMRQQLVELLWTPIKWQLTVLGSSFPMFGLNTLASAGQPHT